MSWRAVLGLLLFTASSAFAATDFAGEYADRKFLGGTAVFQLSLEQAGRNVDVWFSAVNSDGSGAEPEAEGKGTVSDNGVLTFTWKDSMGNSGAGSARRAGQDIVLSLKTNRVGDKGALRFYRENMRLARQTTPATKKK